MKARLSLLCLGAILINACKNPPSAPARSPDPALVVAGSHNAGAHPVIAESSPSLRYSDADLQGMNLGELTLLAQERRVQNESEKQELVKLGKLNPGLCQLLEQRKTSCPTLRKIAPDKPSKVLQCDGTYKDENSVAAALQVTIPPGKKGSFILIANGAFISNEFGPGRSDLSFSPLPNSTTGPQGVPTLGQLSSLALRVSPGLDPASLKKLPSLSGFSLALSSAGQTMASGELLPSTDGSLRSSQREYLVDLRKVAEISRSSLCSFSPQQVQEVVARLADSVSSPIPSVKDGALPGERGALIAQINQVQSEIEARLPGLEEARSHNDKLFQELTADSERGCHANEAITAFAVELDGKMIDRERVGTFDSPQEFTAVKGKATELNFDFGGFNFTVDVEREHIIGGRYEVPQDISSAATIGSIDRVVISKRGVSYDNERSCERKYIILTEECHYTCFENSAVALEGLRVFANGKLIYAADHLGLVMNRRRLRVSFPNLYSNQYWTKLMQEKDCTEVR